MYALKNKVQLIGNLGQPPSTGITEKGKKWARFSMATSDSYRTPNGEKITETYWHNIIAWGRLADIAARFLSTGSEVAIEGKLTYRYYIDKHGVQRQCTDVLASELLMLGTQARQKE